LALNNSDWSRFSKKPSSQFWQFLALPLFLTTVGLCGIVGASASEKIWGTDIVEKWNHTPGGRAAAFFSAALWLSAQVSINLSTNSVAFATGKGSTMIALLSVTNLTSQTLAR
jgi:NCS1 family nucleobase:cation symporter-1